jgi:hypothetical protein
LWAAHLLQVAYVDYFPWIIPAPTYWKSLYRITQHMVTENRFSFLLGRTYRGGVWTFFPVTFLLKTPESTLALLLSTIICLPVIWQKNKQILLDMGLYPLIYLSVSVSGALNLGYRHLLPIIPYLYMLVAMNFAVIRKTKYIAAVQVVVVMWQIVIPFFSWPNYIPYFNVFAGGESKGYKYLADSNVDWGQGLIAADRYMETQKVDNASISAFTPFINPNLSYGIEASMLPPQRGPEIPLVLSRRYYPKPGNYIMSASTLRGLQVADTEMYNWFWHQEPKAVIAGSMLHYHVEPLTPEPEWVAQCSTPVTPLSHDDIEERFGFNDLRTVTFDCSQSWLFPGDGLTPGWFVLHSGILDDESVFRSTMLEYTKLVFQQRIQGESPTHSVYLAEGGQFSKLKGEDIIVSPGDWTPVKAINEGLKIKLPIQFGEILTLLGYEVKQSTSSIVFWTMWEVDSELVVPVSMMAHLINENNSIISNGDSFGIPFTTLIPGDVFVQQHIFDVNTSENNWIQAGVYRLDSLARYPVGDGSSVLGDRILIYPNAQ